MEPSNKSQRKPHWSDDIKFHDPDYPLKWAVAIFSWQILAVFVGFWILVNILPWNAIGQIPGYSGLTSFMNDLIPRYMHIPPDYRYSGLEEQFTAINVMGGIYLVFIALKTGNMPIRNKNAPWWTFPSLVISIGIVFAFFIFFLMVEPSTIATMSNEEISKWYEESYPPSSWKFTFKVISYWYAIGITSTLTIAAFRTSTNQFYSFLRK